MNQELFLNQRIEYRLPGSNDIQVSTVKDINALIWSNLNYGGINKAALFVNQLTQQVPRYSGGMPH